VQVTDEVTIDAPKFTLPCHEDKKKMPALAIPEYPEPWRAFSAYSGYTRNAVVEAFHLVFSSADPPPQLTERSLKDFAACYYKLANAWKVVNSL